MGAFENAIREAETFDSLLDLYREAQVELARLRAEIEKLRADVIWALKTRTAFTDAMVNGPFLMINGERVKVDGTDAGLLDAVRRAREGTE